MLDYGGRVALSGMVRERVSDKLLNNTNPLHAQIYCVFLKVLENISLLIKVSECFFR